MTDGPYRYLTKPVVLGIGKCLRRGDYDALARVNTHRVEIFHVAHGDAIVGTVAHDLVLDFFPSAEVFFDEYLRHIAKDICKFCGKFFFIPYDSRPLTAEREPCAHHDRISDFFCGCYGFLGIRGCAAPRGLHINSLEPFYKKVPVFGVAYRRNGSAEDAHSVFFENSGLFEREPKVQCSLSAEGKGYRVWALFAYDLRREFLREREEVHRVGALLVGLHRGDVGIHQDDAHAVLFEGLDRLRTRIVEFSRLTDAEASGAQ